MDCCPVCFHQWDLQDVRPKSLSCLHSFCKSCLERLVDRRCPTCRKAFTEPVQDNFALVASLEARDLERPPVAWWCTDCQRTASAACVDEHDVRRPKAALRRGLQDWTPAALQDLQGIQDGLQGLQDGAALTALRLLRGVPAACKVTLRLDDGDAFGAECRVGGQEHAEDSLLRTLVVALAASGRLQQEPRGALQEAALAAQDPTEQPREVQPEASTSAQEPAEQPTEDQPEVATAAQEPADQRIEVLDLCWMYAGSPACTATGIRSGVYTCCAAPRPRWRSYR